MIANRTHAEFILSRKGFTLAELLVAAALLAFVAAGLLQTFIVVHFLNGVTQNNTIAIAHAQYVMENIKGADFNAISTGINNGTWNWNASTISARGLAPLSNETIAAQVSGTSLLDVKVTVSWRDRSGAPQRSTYLETYFSQP